MSAIKRNLFKIVIGSALGTAVGLAVNRMSDRDHVPEDEQPADEGPSMSPIEKVTSIPERLKERWQAAREAGLTAQAEEEARLTMLFREKVDDPNALTEESPTESAAEST